MIQESHHGTRPVRKLRLIHSPTPGWETMRRFYRDQLLLEQTGGWDQENDRGAFLSLETGELELMELDAADIGIVPTAQSPWTIALQVDSAEAECARLRDIGVPILRAVEARPWGSQDFLIQDPAGNVLLIFSHN